MARYGLVVLLACSSCGSCQQTNPNTALDRVCDPGAATCISLSTFRSNIDQALKGNVTGYVSIVGGLPQATVYGQARLPQDGAVAWTVDTPINVMSVTKVLTTIGVLQLMAKNNIQLTDKMEKYLPPDWQKAAGPGIDRITFEDLLTHRSGFRGGPQTDYNSLNAQITGGVLSADYGVPKYNNRNFALFRILMPAMDGVPDSGDATRDQKTSDWYIAYIRAHVLKPVLDDTGDCKPTGGAQQAEWYPAPPTPIHGDDGGDWTLKCGGGGWSLAASDLYRVVLSLAGNEQLLTQAQKDTMNAKCLGWDCSIAKQNDFVGKNGGWHDADGAHVETFIGLFHDRKIQVVLLVNSPIPGEGITKLVATAYENARVPNH